MDPPGVMLQVKWTHWDDLVTIYGVGPDGYARSAWDNVGVQYGLDALRDGNITPAEFLDLNAKVGSWKPAVADGAGGLPVRAGRLRQPGPVRPVECPQHAPVAGRRRDAGSPDHRRPAGDRRGVRVGPRLPGRHRHPDHRLAALPRGPAGHAQLPPVLRHPRAHAQPRRPRRQPGHLVHRRAAGRRLRPDARRRWP